MAPRKALIQDEEWSTKEVANYIGMSRQWVSVAATNGTLPSYRLSERGRFHFRKSEIEAWYEARTTTRAAS